MERNQLVHLSYITPISNIPSILQHGILCHNLAKDLKPASIAAEEIQDRRRRKRVPQGKLLHDCANLYINPRNPMMFRRRALHESICVLKIDPCAIDIPDVVVSDQNAASDWARFAAAPEGLSIVDFERTSATDWTMHEDQRDVWRHKAQMCAEVLVPKRIAPNYIVGAYVSCLKANIALTSTGFAAAIELRPSIFFRQSPATA